MLKLNSKGIIIIDFLSFRIFTVMAANLILVALIVRLTDGLLDAFTQSFTIPVIATNLLYWFFPSACYTLISLLDYSFYRIYLRLQSYFFYKFVLIYIFVTMLLFFIDYYAMSDSYNALTNVSILLLDGILIIYLSVKMVQIPVLFVMFYRKRPH